MDFQEQYTAMIGTINEPGFTEMIKEVTHPSIIAAYVALIEDIWCDYHGYDVESMNKTVGNAIHDVRRMTGREVR